MIDSLAELFGKIAVGPGAVFAILCGLFAGFAAWAMAMLSYGSTPLWSAWIALKGFAFGIWLAYTPFAVLSIIKYLLDRR